MNQTKFKHKWQKKYYRKKNDEFKINFEAKYKFYDKENGKIRKNEQTKDIKKTTVENSS